MQQDMQNNNQNSWKSRVEDDAAFAAGEMIDSTAAWDKLYNRLHQPRRKKSAWYWMAAAGIFIIIFFSIYVQQPVKHDDGIAIAPKPQTTIKSNKLLVPIQKVADEVIENKERITAIPVVKEKALNKKELPVIKPVIQPLPEENIQEDIPVAVIQQSIKKEDSLPVASVQPKQKLKVIHVNELGGTAENTTIKRGSDYSTLQFGVNKTTSPAGKIGIQISTSKTSSN